MDAKKISINKLSKLPQEDLGTVYQSANSIFKLYKDENPKRYYFVKVVKKENLYSSKEEFNRFTKECKLLTLLNHPSVIKTESAYQDEKYVYIIQEGLIGGLFFDIRKNFDQLVKASKDGKEMQHEDIKNEFSTFIAQIVNGLGYIHQKNIIYRNLCPETLGFDNLGRIKFFDFGLSIETEQPTSTICGVPDYQAPEMIMGYKYDKSVDYWALGVLMYELYVQVLPFYDENPLNVYKKILKDKVKFPKGIDPKAKSLMKHLLEKDPTKRYGCLKGGIDDIKRHRYLKDADWAGIGSAKLKTAYKEFLNKPNETMYIRKFNLDYSAKAFPNNVNDDPFSQMF